jgi:hypothetical protein
VRVSFAITFCYMPGARCQVQRVCRCHVFASRGCLLLQLNVLDVGRDASYRSSPCAVLPMVLANASCILVLAMLLAGTVVSSTQHAWSSACRLGSGSVTDAWAAQVHASLCTWCVQQALAHLFKHLQQL